VKEDRWEWLKTFFAGAADFIFMLDADGIIRKANRVHVEHREEDVVGQPVSKFVPPEYQEALGKAFRQARETGRPQTVETMVELPDGSHCFLNRLNPLPSEEDGVAVVLFATDITERKRTEGELVRHSHELGERVKELSCLYGIDRIGDREGITLKEIFSEAVKLIPSSWQHPDRTAGRITFEGEEFRTPTFKETGWRQATDITVDTQPVGSIEVFYTVEMPEEDEGPFLKEERALIDSMAVRLSHIVRRRRAEQSLQEERWRLANTISGTNVGTWEWNVQTGQAVFNERWAEIIGYTLDEISPVSIETWMKFSHPDDLKSSDKMLRRHFAGELEYHQLDCRMKHRDGYWVWVNHRGKVFSWTDDNKPLLMFGTHQDITERKRMELALRKSEEQQKQLSRTDGLTGLLNRRGWNEYLAIEESRARRYGHLSSVVVLDLDGLKTVNDVQGHAAGDALICRAAKAIRSAVRDTDRAARTGGDEFAVLVVECSEKQMDTILKRIERALSMAEVGASWGMAVRNSDTGLRGAMAEADRLMYEMKARHRGTRTG